MDKLNREELSLNMRIPADSCYVVNAILTLEGICDHFFIGENSRMRIAEALKKALLTSVNFSYQKYRGLFDLKFLVFKDRLQITVEDFMLSSEDTTNHIPASEIEVKRALEEVSIIVDELIVFSEVGRNSCYSMQFNFKNSEVE